jgi:chromosome segregation protein
MARLLRLDRMEILGFKSFYGKTRFEFPEGITAVVGPNGCGKSNIGDAISWVLGEQKASSLRSDRMEDVIFNGSQKRRPLGMAEVSLHFRNLAHTAGNGGNGHAKPEGNGNGHAAAAGNGGLAVETAGEEPAATEAGGGGNGHDVAIAAALIVETQDGAAAPVAIPIATGVEAPPATGTDEPHPRIVAIEEIPEEVVVTRRLYRSGESEYILNGERCRLKDIQHLLARTDVGSRLYSTIEQGKIDQILTAKPKDRRALFEEAAGILGYKTRKRQAEAKLEATRANLLRIADITAEVDKQMQSLKRQAAKARRYQRLMEDLRGKRLLAVHRRLLLLDEDRRSTAAAQEDMRTREAAAAADLARQEADLETLRLRLEQEEDAARRRRERIHALDLELDRMTERLRAAGAQSADLTTRIAEADQEIAALADRALDQQARRVALESEIEAAGARMAVARERIAALDEDLRLRTGAVEEAIAREAAARGAWEEGIRTATEDARQGAALEEQQRSHAAAIERIDDEDRALRADRAAIGTALAGEDAAAGEADRRLAELQAGGRVAQAEHEAATERAGAAARHAEDLRARAAALDERFATLEAIVRRHADAPAGLASVLQGAAGFLPLGIVGDRLEIAAGLERAAEAALAGLAEAVLVRDLRDAGRGVDHLRANAGGRSAFVTGGLNGDMEGAPAGRNDAPALPEALATAPGVGGRLIDAVRGDLPPAIATALARAVIAADLDRALDLSAGWPDWIFVTPAGDRVEGRGVVIGGDTRALESGLLLRRADLAEVERDIAAVAAERSLTEDGIAAARQAAEKTRARIAAIEDQIRGVERARFELDVNRGRRRADLARIDLRLPLVGTERARLERARLAAAAALEAIAGRTGAAEAARLQAEEAMRLAAGEVAARRAGADAIQAGGAEAKAAAAGLAERCEALARERQVLETSTGETRDASARRGAARAEFAARVLALAEESAAIERQREESRSLRAAASAEDEAAHAGLAYDRSLLHARDQGVRDGRAAHEDLRGRLQERELHLARVEAQIEGLETICREDLETTVAALRTQPPPPPDDRPIEDQEKELESLKAELQTMGAVNLMAIEQHAELEERFNLLDGQQKDLEASIAQLQETIRKLDRQSKERFLAAFEAIQGHFQATFTTLFGGGQAELRLQEDEGSVLEAGIEIAAQPPGKKLQKIALLSGGEKALTAAALLFSLFRYRPSPFCVLDEVDAPLDEANVDRFTRLLQELRTDTQFILITHNRKSMEAADLLYGVTMEEPGVSKVLPLRFE